VKKRETDRLTFFGFFVKQVARSQRSRATQRFIFLFSCFFGSTGGSLSKEPGNVENYFLFFNFFCSTVGSLWRRAMRMFFKKKSLIFFCFLVQLVVRFQRSWAVPWVRVCVCVYVRALIHFFPLFPFVWVQQVARSQRSRATP